MNMILHILSGDIESIKRIIFTDPPLSINIYHSLIYIYIYIYIYMFVSV